MTAATGTLMASSTISRTSAVPSMGSGSLRGVLGPDAEAFELALDLLVLGRDADGGGDLGIVAAQKRTQRPQQRDRQGQQEIGEAEKPRHLRIGERNAQRRVGAV